MRRRLASILLHDTTAIPLVLTGAFMACYASHAFGCSGPGAHRAIAENIAYARWTALGVALGLLPIGYRYVRAGLHRLAVGHFGLLVLHPLVWLSARSGDCGGALASMSTFYLVATAVAWIVSPAVANRYRVQRRSTTGLCPACGYHLRATPDRCPECGTRIRATARVG